MEAIESYKLSQNSPPYHERRKVGSMKIDELCGKSNQIYNRILSCQAKKEGDQRKLKLPMRRKNT